MRILIILLLLVTYPAFSSYSPHLPESVELGLEKEKSEGELLISSFLSYLEASGTPAPTREALDTGIAGYLKLVNSGKIQKGKPLTIIDFSLPSTEKRLWTLDPESGAVLHHSLVAHGRNSGNVVARKFSNVNASYMSSLGFYVTAETYSGKHGYSLRLDGLEKGFNDQARNRAIVIHGADYANPDFIRTTGRLGRSLGCPALPTKLSKTIIDSIKENSCLFIYADDPDYKKKSPFVTT